MDNQTLQALLQANFENADIQVEGDGSHFDVLIIAAQFAGLNTLERQRSIYTVVNEHITSGTIHALNMKAYTPEEWNNE